MALAWEKSGQVYLGALTGVGEQPLPEPTAAAGAGGGRKHPVLAVNAAGERLLAWTENTGWNRGGTFAWEIVDAQGQPTGQHGHGGPVPAWSTVAAFARADGSFVVLH